jgi:hypothetical protein
MIDLENIDRVVARLAVRNNLTPEDAEEAFRIIGGWPFLDADGRAVVTLEDRRTLFLVRES